VEYHARDAANPDFAEVARALLKQVWYAPQPRREDGRAAAVILAVRDLVVTRLMGLAANPEATPAVRAAAAGRLRDLRDALKKPGRAGVPDDHARATIENIDRFLARPDAPFQRTAPLPVPPGDPIGAGRGAVGGER
jgi:hypothetical protein